MWESLIHSGTINGGQVTRYGGLELVHSGPPGAIIADVDGIISYSSGEIIAGIRPFK